MNGLIKVAVVGVAATAISVGSSVLVGVPAQAATVTVTATVCINGISHTSAPGPYGTTIDVPGGPC